MSELIERQRELEYESVVMGRERYACAREDQPESASEPAREQTRRAVPMLAQAIAAFTEAAATATTPGRRHCAVRYLVHLDPGQAAYITIRHAIDAAAQGQKVNTVALGIGNGLEDHLELLALSESAPGLYRKVMEQIKTTTRERHRTGVLRRVISRYARERLNWSDSDKLHLGVKLLELFESACGLITLQRQTAGRHNTPIFVVFTEPARQWFQQTHERLATFSPVHMPMLVPPRDWTDPFHGGYLTRAIRRAFLVQTHAPETLDEMKRHDMSAVYAAVNTIQRTAWRINKPLLSIMRESRSLEPRPDSLFVEADRPLPLRPAGIDANIPLAQLDAGQREALQAWKREAALVHAHNGRLRGKRAAVAQKLCMAEKFKDEAAIYFPHYLDFRGRIYPYANYLNPQSDDCGRALLEFAAGKPVGARGAFWLKVHLANLFGIDKVSFAERLRWVDAHSEQLLACAASPLSESFWRRADRPWCALAAILEYAGWLVQGEDYVSHLPIAMDGSCSGLQHFSAMLRDPVGAAAVNLLPADKPGDIYTAVAERAQRQTNDSLEDAASPWKPGKVSRRIAKQPTMTLCYSATVFGMYGQILSAVESLGGQSYLGVSDLRPPCRYMAQVIWDAIAQTVVAARDAMQFLRELAALACEAQLPIRWIAPSGFPVVQAYRQSLGRRIDLHYKGQVVKLTIAAAGTRLDRRKQQAGVAPNFVHSLDSAHLMATVNLGHANDLDSWACIHDSFGVHAADVDLLNVCIREAFIEQYTPDVLADLRAQIIAQLTQHCPALLARVPPLPIRGTLELGAVREAAYFFA